MNSELTSLVEDLVKRLVDSPEEVQINQNQGDNTIVFEVRVAKKDMGKIIGKKGKTIDALRVIIGACGAKEKKRCVFQIIEDEE